MNELVSILIPVRNSSLMLKDCLESISTQKYKPIQVILIDSNSKDDTQKLAKKYNVEVVQFNKTKNTGMFEAPAKRNFGASIAKGKYLYYLDVDMILPANAISEAVELCKGGYDGVIFSEDSFGIGIWAEAKSLERKCYWGDDTVEAPRFITRRAWDRVGGLDVEVGGGGDDWDMYQKLLEKGFKVCRAGKIVRHNEGNLSIYKLMKKRFMYGTQTLKYIKKRPKAGVISYFPIRASYIKNWKVFLSHPKTTAVFIAMRFLEYSAGFAGILFGILRR